MRSHVAWPGLVASSVLTLAATAQCPVETEIVGLQAFAEYGSSVAMSASGHLAIVGGPSAAIDQQGLVRVYERIGERFVEHEPLAPIPAFGFSATFGRSVDLSDDGNTAVVGAPGDLDGVPGFRKGSVYVFERDSSTGVWSKTIRITQDPPTTEYSFGTRVAISGDGDTIVIAQSNDIGSEFDGLPDNVYVITRDGGWADLTPLAPAAPVDPFDQFGEAIAVSEDGATIVTRSFDHDTFAARVHVFERDGSSYSETQIIEHAVGDIFDGFGRALAVTGDTLVIGDNGIDIDVPDLGPFPNVGLVNIYTRGDGRWSFVESFYPLAEVVPDSTFGFSGYIDLGFGGSVALRGDELLVGSTSH
ncbi:MAG: FG-GAP repeat protein, partial [Acidimicrobiia bacterium]|nr:FG-GAP repeat protein [Acidimicrobiia bacterium]